jgi:hypothetical protein
MMFGLEKELNVRAGGSTLSRKAASLFGWRFSKQIQLLHLRQVCRLKNTQECEFVLVKPA